MDAMSAVDPRPNEIVPDIPISAEIQAICYRQVLRIIKEKKCSYEEAWKIFREKMEERLFSGGCNENGMKIGRKILKEAERRQQFSDRQAMDNSGDEPGDVCKAHRAQRRVRTAASAAGKDPE